MSKKNVDDYLTEGMYGVRLPKDEERKKYLGTLRERIVLALTKGQVMSDSGLKALESEMKANPEASLLINGHVSHRFLKEEKELAKKYNIHYTTLTDEENDTDIGAVLTYDYAIDKEHIFMDEESDEQKSDSKESPSLLSRLKKWFS
ncbi:YueI family protein [Virgibacillus xinjiangensis]|uniref:YueI family protein n=1 Tax=Virgibacillus xinjiangensis TaxID=393090 RepID=A0ABV7CYU7_9BACI